MTIPNSFSTEDLQNAMKKATKEKDTQLSAEEYQEKIVEIAERHVSAAFDELCDPVLHKAMAVLIIQQLCTYHEQRSVHAFEKEQPQVAALWARDLGQLMAALRIVQNTSVDQKDFMSPD